MAKRLLCVLLSVLMVVAMLPMGVVADSTTTVLDTQTSAGTLSILSSIDYTDSSYYIYVNYEYIDSTDGYLYYEPGVMCGFDSDWSYVELNDGYMVSSYKSCSGTYVVNLAELATAVEAAGGEPDKGFALNWYNPSYASFTSVQLVQITTDGEEVVPEDIFPVEEVSLTVGSGDEFDSSTGTLTLNSNYSGKTGWFFGSDSTLQFSSFIINLNEALTDQLQIVINYTDGTSEYTYPGSYSGTSIALSPDSSLYVKSIVINANNDAPIEVSISSVVYVIPGVLETSIEDVDYTVGSSGEFDSSTGTTTINSNYAGDTGWFFGDDSTLQLSNVTIVLNETLTDQLQIVINYTDGTSTITYPGSYSGLSLSLDFDSTLCVKSIVINANNDAPIDVSFSKVTYIVAETTSTTTPTFSSRTLSLGGMIGVNFYVDFGDIDVDTTDYHVVFTVDDTETEAYVSEATAMGDGIYAFTCDVPCWEMGTTITAVITDGADVVDTMTYSVSKYATNMSGYSDALDNLLNAMLVYGNYASAYKNDGTTVTSVTDNTSTVTDLSDYAVGTTLDSSIITAKLTLDETCELSFTVGDDYTVSIDGEETDTLSDILVQSWDTEHTIVVLNSDGEEVYNFKYSVLSYANTVVSNSDSYDASLVNLVKAMYLYNVAADAYIG